MNMTDYYYRDLVDKALKQGLWVDTRNSRCLRLIHQSKVFHHTPLVCVRKTAWKNALREWEWFMSGSNDIKDLHESVRPWWQPWADSDGRVCFNYSREFRESSGSWGMGTWPESVDQIELLIDGVANHPYSRRNVITTWNTANTTSPECKITNCHGTVIQAFVGSHQDPKSLHIVTYQRSGDIVCGVPHNWIAYWAFLIWLASRTGTNVGSLTWIGGDVHLYEQHVRLSDKIIAAQPTQDIPELIYTPTSQEFRADDFTLSRVYSPAILDKAEMVV